MASIVYEDHLSITVVMVQRTLYAIIVRVKSCIIVEGYNDGYAGGLRED